MPDGTNNVPEINTPAGEVKINLADVMDQVSRNAWIKARSDYTTQYENLSGQIDWRNNKRRSLKVSLQRAWHQTFRGYTERVGYEKEVRAAVESENIYAGSREATNAAGQALETVRKQKTETELSSAANVISLEEQISTYCGVKRHTSEGKIDGTTSDQVFLENPSSVTSYQYIQRIINERVRESNPNNQDFEIKLRDGLGKLRETLGHGEKGGETLIGTNVEQILAQVEKQRNLRTAGTLRQDVKVTVELFKMAGALDADTPMGTSQKITDRIAWAVKDTRLGRIITDPIVLGLVAASLDLGSRAIPGATSAVSSWLTFGAIPGLGAVAAGIREYAEVKRDIAQQSLERGMGIASERDLQNPNKRRKEVAQYMQSAKSSHELHTAIDRTAESFNFNSEASRNAFVNAVADRLARDKVSQMKHVILINYGEYDQNGNLIKGNEPSVWKNRKDDLYFFSRAMVRAKDGLNAAQQAELDNLVKQQVDQKVGELQRNVEETEKKQRNYALKQATYKAATSFVAGILIGGATKAVVGHVVEMVGHAPIFGHQAILDGIHYGNQVSGTHVVSPESFGAASTTLHGATQEIIPGSHTMIDKVAGMDLKVINSSQMDLKLPDGRDVIIDYVKDANGVFHPSAAALTNLRQNFGIDLSESGGSVVNKSLNTAVTDQAWLASHNFETATRNSTEKMVYHVLHDPSVGHGTHNELTLHYTKDGVDFGGQLTKGAIDSHWAGVGPAKDQLLGEIIDKHGGNLAYKDMVAVFGVHGSTEQLIVPLDAAGKAHLPPELLDAMGRPKGFDYVSTAVLTDENKNVLAYKAGQSLNSLGGKFQLHSLASIRLNGTEASISMGSENIWQIAVHEINPARMANDYTQEMPWVIPMEFSRKPLESISTETLPVLPPPGPRHPRPTPGGPYGRSFENAIDPYLTRTQGYSEQELKDYYKSRCHPELQANPNAHIGFKEATDWYFSNQDRNYMENLEKLNEEIEEPMSPNCKLSICIPVAGHQEGRNIYKTLELYKKQNGVSNDEFEIQLFVNLPTTASLDQTLQEIERFKRENPNVPVRVAGGQFVPGSVVYGTFIKYAYDLALLRANKRPLNNNQDMIVATGDADLMDISPNYVKDSIEFFQNPANQEFDAGLAKQDHYEDTLKTHPTFWAAMRFHQFVEAQGRAGRPGWNAPKSQSPDRESKHIQTQGRTTLVRGSVLASIGGVNYNTPAGADTEISDMILRARKGVASGISPNENYPLAYLNRISIQTNPRRELATYLSGKTITHTWEKFDEGENVRDKDINQLNSLSTETIDTIDVQRLEQEINAFIAEWGGGHADSEYVKRSLGWLGIEYEVQGNKVILKNIDKLKTNMKSALAANP